MPSANRTRPLPMLPPSPPGNGSGRLGAYDASSDAGEVPVASDSEDERSGVSVLGRLAIPDPGARLRTMCTQSLASNGGAPLKVEGALALDLGLNSQYRAATRQMVLPIPRTALSSPLPPSSPIRDPTSPPVSSLSASADADGKRSMRGTGDLGRSNSSTLWEQVGSTPRGYEYEDATPRREVPLLGVEGVVDEGHGGWTPAWTNPHRDDVLRGELLPPMPELTLGEHPYASYQDDDILNLRK
ncbi:hypothetical protein C8T65DRAFT_747532 [Cerioporus squamosus]|nr:hypothetical protein C8T65DRAFT_747532 [Cerioporus squamosus]